MIEFLRQLLGSGKGAPAWISDGIIRDELFSSERLEQHAASLARAQDITRRPVARRSLNARLSDNEVVLLSAYRSLAEAAGEGRDITPAAEWLIDNYHLVEAQIRQIQDDLPPRFYRELPKLASGPLAGYPRVFGIAWACVAHSDSRFDPDALRRFVRAYQKVEPLKIGELWAVAITLRIVLVENLRRAAERIVSNRVARDEADEVADQLLGVNKYLADPDALLRRYERDTELPSAFVVQLVKRLRDQDPRVTPALVWLETQLTAQGTTSDAMVHDEHQRQGASNVTVRNIITSMRLISDVNWPEFFEDVSLVDEVLQIGSDFRRMDFATRNLYRSAIERLARGSSLSELEVTRAAMAAASQGTTERERDPGYHLLSLGRRSFEKSIRFRTPHTQWLRRANALLGPSGYIGSVLVGALVILCLPMLVLLQFDIALPWLELLALTGWIPALDLSVALVNRAVTGGFGATLLPGLALLQGIPEQFRTMVVVPTLLSSPESIEEQIERLEVHFLASAPGAVHFALLSDWTDCASESAATDAALLAVAVRGIARLNALHGPMESGHRFYLLHRRRVWSEGQQRWMGWERKRGKLHELNRWLRGRTDTTFVDLQGQPPLSPAGVRYVITLDADTRLPRETVRRLIGKLAHPLNQAVFDPKSGRVLQGYAVLQPRVTPSLPVGREGSLFQRVFSGMTGIDAYGVAVSDVYQDLFNEGSYAGKGIYDVDAFEAALAERVPESTLLSHDLFEGSFARAGMASDIEVVEEYPSRYDVAAARDHRWARGDWQLLPWMLGRADSTRRAVRLGGNSLPLIALWKMTDNLRRTLSAPVSMLALFAGWLLPWHAALLWTGYIIATIALPALLPALAAILPRRPGVILRSHLRALQGDAWLATLQVALVVTFLAHRATLMADAILRTLYRLTISRRNLLQWVSAAQAQHSSRLTLDSYYRGMGLSVLLVLAAVVALVIERSNALWIAIPFALLWTAAPAIARWSSESPLVAGRLAVPAEDAQALRLVARSTWRYFETFVTPDENLLPPDNFQEDPRPVVAHRTSPTNIGLYLLCVVSARDFGWAGTVDCVAWLEATLATLQRMQRVRGHFYNWYDTRDLHPLEPTYVSTVDSGNLAAHLIAVANACREWITTAVPAATSVAGIEDALLLARTALQKAPDKRLEGALDIVENELQWTARSTSDVREMVASLEAHGSAAADEAHALADEHRSAPYAELLFWVEALRASVVSWHRDVMQSDEAVRAMSDRLVALENATRAMALAMEFDFLLDPERKLLSIGYRPSDGTLDPSCYDILASEARLASFFAIAKNDAPTRHWFRLGRAVTPIGNGAALISWSGSMFEYLMPALVMRAPAASLLEQTSRLIVYRQIKYGASLDVPWGVSESAYNARDVDLTYQYSNFGVPGLGLKRGLSANVVIAPYATGLAAMVDPESAARNFVTLAKVGARGRYGFYEALDYTRSRLPEGAQVVIVKAFMAHHQGMTVVAIANVLFDGRMRARFHAEASVQATELLLQERTPRDVSVAHPRAEEVDTPAPDVVYPGPEVRCLRSVHSATPQTHLLANGRYSVMLTAAGSGYSRWRDQGVTRWNADATRDDSGSYIFLRDITSGQVWSAGFQPCGIEPGSFEVNFTEDRAEFIRSDGDITTNLQVLVSPEDDAEARRVSITNNGNGGCEIDVTSYCELVLNPPAADSAHPAFSKLFVQTEYVAKQNVLLATRRKRSPGDADIWAVHHAVVEGVVIGSPEYETDRARFIGRGNEISAPSAVMDGRVLSNTVGTVLDPIFALRYRVRIAAGSTVKLSFWTGVAATREGALDLYDKHHDANAFTRASTLAWTQAQVQLRHLGISAEEANLFQRLAGHVLYTDASLRPASDTIQRGGGTASALWAQGISGDLPLVLLRIQDIEDIAIARQLLQAHEYLRLKQLAIDLVILNERSASYVQDLQTALETLVRASHRDNEPNRGSVYVLRSDLISAATRGVLSAAARVVIVAQRGTLAEQLEHRIQAQAGTISRPRRKRQTQAVVAAAPPRDLEFFNGTGGFAAEGREYLVTLDASQSTPAPWINVVSNPDFGFHVAAEGGGYTWSINSRENQLTQWGNDPVTDRPGEVLYVRDEDSGELWGPTVAPVRDAAAPYTVRHGQGYSRFVHNSHGIELELLAYVPLKDPVKISRLKLRNTSSQRRRLSVTAYVEWVLGTSRAASAPFIVTERDAKTGALFARNPWSAAFGARVAFADLGGRQSQWTADRQEFLGRHGGLDQPAALAGRLQLSGRTGAGLDPCAALLTLIELEPGATIEILFLLGEAQSALEAQTLLERYRSADLDASLAEVTRYWDEVLGTVQVKTPDRAMDLMLNRWLLYQTLACRIWARSAFYQASGAYGFRDQLQDGMALTTSQPALTREHLLRAAGRQFPEGDFQHWWLPPLGQGVRTRISDDRVWLAFTCLQYLDATGDASVLDEKLAFIEGRKLDAPEHDAFFLPTVSDDRVTLYEHCARALDASLAVGVHGLPLMGTGDWNDGMNRVGQEGRGESVWLGWFLYTTLSAFAPVAEQRGDSVRGRSWLAHAAQLRESLEREAWDGAWYRRGYFDDGSPLGSAASDECRIDSIAQSWSVLSGAADLARSVQAMAAVDELLIRREESLALLFTPPFDKSPLDPGYIKGYPPGLRENGGQYTHAAIWSVLAFAKLGQGDKAAELFSLLNPINHSNTRTGMRRYKVEPYVVAADVYSEPPHVGRGGWTWYTGSSGWMYRAGLEGILGFQLRGAELVLTPCIPKSWPRFEITFRYRTARYDIVVENPNAVSSGAAQISVDGQLLPPSTGRIMLQDDGATHQVHLTLGHS